MQKEAYDLPRKIRRAGSLHQTRWKRLASKRSLAAILILVTVALTILDYQLYHGPQPRGFGFDYKLMPPFTPDITLPVLTFPKPESAKSLDSTNAGTSILLTRGSSDNQPSAVLRVGVYCNDPAANVPQPLDAINWSDGGPIMPGQSVNSSKVYLRNEGVSPVTLYFSSLGWTFEDANGEILPSDYRSYFTLSWDYDNTSVAVNEVRPMTFSLTVSPNIENVATFSFDLSITLTG